MTDRIYRTLREAETMRDFSNYTLRFNRTLPGGMQQRSGPTPTCYFLVSYIAILGAILLALI